MSRKTTPKPAPLTCPTCTYEIDGEEFACVLDGGFSRWDGDTCIQTPCCGCCGYTVEVALPMNGGERTVKALGYDAGDYAYSECPHVEHAAPPAEEEAEVEDKEPEGVQLALL